jgi:hypothetical protein
MRTVKLSVLVGGLLGLCLAAVGCDKKDDHAATPPAASSAHTTTTAPASTSAAVVAPSAAAASAAPSASASAGAAGEIHQHIASVKTVSGKVDGGERRIKSKSTAIRNKCVKPAADKKAEIDGSLKLVIETGADGKVTKTTPTVTGKIPDDVVSCIQKYVEKEFEFDTNDAKAKLEAVFEIGPNAKEKLSPRRGPFRARADVMPSPGTPPASCPSTA